MDLSNLSDSDLLKAVWSYDTGRSPLGYISLENYLEELVGRCPHQKLYHSELTAAERLAQIKKPLIKYGGNR